MLNIKLGPRQASQISDVVESSAPKGDASKNHLRKLVDMVKPMGIMTGNADSLILTIVCLKEQTINKSVTHV